jgi:hypothetical protein
MANATIYTAILSSRAIKDISAFPYLTIYRLNGPKKIIWIVSVFHTSLNPKKKYSQ